MKPIHIVIALFALPFITLSQSQLCYFGGGPSNDQAHSVTQANDGSYVIAGQTASFGSGGIDVYLMKTSALGSVIWTRTVGGSGNDYGRSIVKTFDGGYAIAGTTSSFGAGSDDFYLIKTDGMGTVQWTKTYGGSGSDQAWELVQTPDSGFCIAGQTASFGASPNDCYVVRTDANGNLIWDKKVGAASQADIAYSITNTNDGGFAIAGTAYTWTGSANSSSNDFYIVKLDASGNMVWSRLVQDANATKYPDYARSIIQTADGGYMIAGEAGQPKVNGGFNWHYLLVKLDGAGQVSWTRYYGGTQIPNFSTDGSDYAESVIQMNNGDYLVGGYTFSFNYNFNLAQQVGLEYYLVRVSGTGALLDTKIIGTAENDLGKCLIKTSDGGYLVAGYAQEKVAGTYPDEIYMVKLDSTLSTCCTLRTGGADRGTGPTNTTRGTSSTAGGIAGTGGSFGSGGNTTIICGLPALNANFQSTMNQLCPNNNCVDFSDLSGGSPSSWSWSFPGAIPATSNLQNPTGICYATPGSYNVSLIVGNGNSFDTLVMVNYINSAGSPAVPTITANGPSTFCSGDSVLLSSSYPNGNTWTPTGNTSSNFYATSSGTYTVTYTDANGCTATSNPITLTVNPSPPAPIVNPQGPLIICADGVIQLYSNTSGGNVWSPNGETTDTIMVYTPGNYYVLNSSGPCPSSASNIVTVNLGSNPNPPVISLTGTDTLYCSSASSYQWYLNGNPIQGATGQFYVPTANGSYSVYVTNEDGCGTMGEPYEFTLNELTHLEGPEWIIAPNPASNFLTILWKNNSRAKIQVLDIQGKLLISQTSTSGNENLDISSLSEGIYWVNLVTDKGNVQPIKVIVSR